MPLELGMFLLLSWCGAGWSAPALSRPDPLDVIQGRFDAMKYSEVIASLSDTELPKLPRQDLPKAYILLGQSYQRLGELDRAVGVLQLAVGLFPKDLTLLSDLANLLHSVELDDRARPLYERILQAHPNNAAANLGLAEIDEAQGDLENSGRHYEACLREWKMNAAVWRAYAQVLSQSRDFHGAAIAIEKSLALEPENVESLRSLAGFQFNQGLRSDAHKTLLRACELAPERQDLRLQNALWLLEEENLDASLMQARRVIQTSPQDPLALWIRASIALRRGKREEARRDLQAVASQSRQAPFAAQLATAMLLKMDWAP